MTGRVVTVVVHWNEPEETARCLASLERVRYPDHAILVVDNASEPSALARLRALAPGARVVESRENLGFAGGNNLGFEEARRLGAGFVFLLNSDATVEPMVLDRLVGALESDPRIGIVGPHVHSLERPDHVLYAGGSFDWRRGESHIRRPHPADAGKLVDVDWIPGCAMLVRAEILDRVGGMDPSYFLYFEETDWCTRVRRAGRRVVLLPEKLAFHSERSSNALTKSPNFFYYYSRNHPRFLLRHARPGVWPRFLPRYLYRTLVFRGALYYALGYLKGRDAVDRARARALVRGLVDFCLGRSGRGPAWLARP
jgi:hypothetical protein